MAFQNVGLNGFCPGPFPLAFPWVPGRDGPTLERRSFSAHLLLSLLPGEELPTTAETMGHMMRELMMGLAECGGFYSSVAEGANRFADIATKSVFRVMPETYDKACAVVQRLITGGPNGEAVTCTVGTPFEGLIQKRVSLALLQAARFRLLSELVRTHGSCGFCVQENGVPRACTYMSATKAGAAAPQCPTPTPSAPSGNHWTVVAWPRVPLTRSLGIWVGSRYLVFGSVRAARAR